MKKLHKEQNGTMKNNIQVLYTSSRYQRNYEW